MRRSTRHVVGVTGAALIASMLSMSPLTANADDEPFEAGLREVEAQEIVPVVARSREVLSDLGSRGYDLGEEVEDVDDGVQAHAVLTKTQQAELRALGIRVGRAVKTQEDFDALQEEYRSMTEAVAAAEQTAEEVGDDLRVQRAQWFADPVQGRFLEVEVWSQAGKDSAAVTLQVAFDAGPGTAVGEPGTQSFNLSRFVDVGQYMFHRANSPVLITTAAPPSSMRVRSILAGEVVGERTVPVTETLTGTAPRGPGAPNEKDPTYESGFVSKYNDATESYAKIEQLAAEFPQLAEIVEMPNQTNGYRRKAQTLLDPPGNRLQVGSSQLTYVAASYGPAIPGAGVPASDAPIELVNSTTQGTFGCGTLTGFTPGSIALVDRGAPNPSITCSFAEKTKSAQDAGAVAVVVVNNVPGAPTAPGGTALPGTTIPTVMIGQEDGNNLKESLPTSGRLIPGVAINNAARVGVDSLAWGHEGGNDITIAAVAPTTANSPLSVDVQGKDITVSLATNGAGARASTAAQVVAAIDAHPVAKTLVDAYTYRGNTGGAVVPLAPKRSLSDFLRAPASVSREPMTVKVLRIGKHRDGSRVGVFGYAQEHAREWVTPLTALESAERLLRNYDNDDNTRKLVDDLDIFIAPSINPDGTHYSIHDNTLQRRNLTRYCTVTGNYDALARNTWGVDLNRNFSVGSLTDGYAGASSSCTNDTFAGPSELSEPEAKNEVWLTEQHPNIKFSMNIHSHGGYFMWAPGAYKTVGRVGLPRPSYGTERYFYEASKHILNRIKEHRGTNIWDARIGPISDVLYSAAGNSGDEHFYNKGIFAWSFEVGAPRRNAANTGWTDVGFTPPYAEGYEESQEFSNGLIGMFEVARMYGRDTVKPSSSLTPSAGPYTSSTKLTFSVSEPADVHYTTDGSRPTLSSPKLAYQGPRQAEATFTLPTGNHTVRWFSVDVKGNVEGGYDPAGKAQNFRQAKLTVG
jgi:hypothetical protein